jgi:ABC-type Na+ efflux pump permease subunit
VATNKSVPRPTYIQPDTCLTDKQFKTYLKFVKDSMKIENQRTKIEYKYIRDTVRIVERSNRVDLRQENKTERTNILQNAKTVRDTTKQAEKTNRTQIKQEEKTKRNKSFTWFLVGVVVGLVIPFFIRLMRLLL